MSSTTNMYREMTTQVKWDNHLSEKIYINQGIQQGVKLSTSLYKCYNNAILDRGTESGLGSHLGTIGVAAPTCADDILVYLHILNVNSRVLWTLYTTILREIL